MSLPLLGAGMATDGFSPLSISGLQFWVDAADSATLYTDSALTTLAVADGDVVGGWADKSGNSRNALQTDGTKKPLLKLAIQNGRNVVRTDGVDDFLSGSLISTSGVYSIFASCRVIANSNYAMLFTGGFGEIRLYQLQGKMEFYSNYVALDTTSCIGASAQFSFINGSSFFLRRDGSQTATSSAQLSSISGVYSIGQRVGGPYFLNCDVFEIMLYNSALSGSDILLVEAYLKAKWGTP